ncbi:MAG TPA: dTDP-4-dehydrorhamnose 3,5-epimerase [Gammaproteobacteria bacterium]|jgi:dTDP-4-dehydrorhamnose 3,5-epimerase
MKVTRTSLPQVLQLEPRVFRDERGVFYESYNRKVLREAAGIECDFVQDNHSRSSKNVLRGMHYQIVQPQGKLVRVVHGRIFDVAVDLRRSSPAFGRWTGKELSGDGCDMLWVPEGFAHGFLVLSESADVLYKATAYYAPEHERVLRWDDPDVGIKWPLDGEPVVAPRDRAGRSLREAEVYP